MSEKGCHTHKHKLSHKHTLTYAHSLTQPRHLLSYKKKKNEKEILFDFTYVLQQQKAQPLENLLLLLLLLYTLYDMLLTLVG